MQPLFAIGVLVGTALIAKGIKVDSVTMIVMGAICVIANLGSLLMRKD